MLVLPVVTSLLDVMLATVDDGVADDGVAVVDASGVHPESVVYTLQKLVVVTAVRIGESTSTFASRYPAVSSGPLTAASSAVAPAAVSAAASNDQKEALTWLKAASTRLRVEGGGVYVR